MLVPVQLKTLVILVTGPNKIVKRSSLVEGFWVTILSLNDSRDCEFLDMYREKAIRVLHELKYS